MALTAHGKKVAVLARLHYGDRIVRQRPCDCGISPDAAWMLMQPQASVWISTVKWLERHGLVAESIEPVDGSSAYQKHDETRRWYQGEMKHRVYAITEAGRDWLFAQHTNGDTSSV